MQLIGLAYAALFITIAISHHNGWPSGLYAMITLHYSLLGVLIIKSIVEFFGDADHRNAAWGSLTAAILSWGIAFKLTWMGYSNYLLMIGAMAIIGVLMLFWRQRRGTFRMRRNFTVAAVPLTFTGGLFLLTDYNALFDYANRSHLSWSPFERIDWSYFHGDQAQNSHYDATIYSLIRYQYRWEFDQFYYRVEAYFDPERSWHTDGTGFLLEHERLHFDLTAVYAGKLRDYYEGLAHGGKDNSIEVERKSATLLREWDQAQELYDEETQHGLNFDAQLRWQEKVDSLLIYYYDLDHAPKRYGTFHPDELLVDTLIIPLNEP